MAGNEFDNQVLLACFHVNNQDYCLCSDRCRKRSLDVSVQARAENNLCRELQALENFADGQLDAQWSATIQRIVNGASIFTKATARSGFTTFGPSMAGHPWYNSLDARERVRFCRKINQIKRVWDSWEVIVENLTRESIKHIDVRTYSIDKLEKAINFQWVQERNSSNGPRKKKKDPVLRGYPEDMITSIVTAITNTGILDHVQYDPEQIKLICKDVQNKINEQFV